MMRFAIVAIEAVDFEVGDPVLRTLVDLHRDRDVALFALVIVLRVDGDLAIAKAVVAVEALRSASWSRLAKPSL